MALPPSDPKRHRRRQLRRALIGWVGGFAIIALIVVAAIAGGDEKEEVVTAPAAHSGGFLDYHMTSAEYEGLHEGENQGEVLQKLGRVGLPESETPIPIISLFPNHDEDVICSYWQIVDAPETAARLCFSTPDGVLAQKLERVLETGLEGEQLIQA